MCIDYINLNRACVKDHNSLLSIDKLVDTTAEHAVVSLVDAISGYHQIQMDPEDEEKIAFLMDYRVYC